MRHSSMVEHSSQQAEDQDSISCAAPISGVYGINDFMIEKILGMPDIFKIYSDGSILSKIGVNGKLSSQYRPAIQNYKGRSYINFERKHISVSRLVFAKFNGGISANLVVNHIDGNPLNNSVSNLELITQGENMRHSYVVLKRKVNKGRAKISKEIADNIRRDRTNMKYSELMRKYGLSKASISEIVNHKTWC